LTVAFQAREVSSLRCRRGDILCYEQGVPIRREPNYLFLTIGLLAAVVLATSAGTRVSLAVAGVLAAAITFLVTAWLVIESKRQLLLAGVLALTALLPFIWLVNQPEQFPDLVERLYILNLVIWLLFTVYIAIVAFHSIMTMKRIRGNEIYGAIYVHLLIGVIFAEIFQLLLAWDPGALYYDPGRFQEPLAIRNNSLLTRPVGDLLYYSFVTLSTVGYGDAGVPGCPGVESDRGGDRHYVRRDDDRAFRLDPDHWKIRAFLNCLYSRFNRN
jgi:hypothetical protein